MSNLVPAVTPLDKGLDLQTAKIVAPPGTVLDGLNYEQVDFLGQKRIDGYARYDGTFLPVLDEYYLIPLAQATEQEGILVSGDRVLAVVLDYTDTDYVVALIDENFHPRVAGKDSGVTPEEHYDNLLNYTQVLRDRVNMLPGAIIALHWFRDRLYAVADVAAVLLDGEVDVQPNDESINGELVLDVLAVAGNTLVFLSTLNATYSPGSVFETTNGSIGTISFDEPAVEPLSDIASFYQALTEQQALDEGLTAGWNFVHQGWRVMFSGGVSLYGDLAALNQNRQGVGVQGPTSTAGSNGRPLLLTQSPNITNLPPQVNGWKSSDDPTSYALNPLTLTDIDTDYTYADAFISWDGLTGVVTAPGADMIGLTEYSPTASVVVDV